MTDEIICPHCDYEFGDSWECIPSGEGELCWVEDCPDCSNKFDVTFDSRNVDNGFTSSVQVCKEEDHNYKVSDNLYKSEYKTNEDISIYSRIEICSICDDYRFTPVKEDGSDFTKQELLNFQTKKRLKNKSKIYLPFKGVKTGSFEVNKNKGVTLKTKESEGNIKMWVEICRWFKDRGFKTQQLPDYLRKRSVEFEKGWIECTVSVKNYTITIEWYQNEIMNARKKGDGRYEHDRYDLITPKMQLEIRSFLNSIKIYLIDKGFEFKAELNDYQILLNDLKVENLSEWEDPKNHMSRDYEDRDKKVMKSGEEKYFYSGKILKKGVIWWRNGNQWRIMCNGELNQTAHWNLFDYQSDPKRKPLSKDAQIQRLHTELTKAEKAHNYDRCKVLWGKLQSHRLYNVWSLKHESWWGGNNSGYINDRTKAGVYTHENIMNNKNYYNNGTDSIAKEIN